MQLQLPKKGAQVGGMRQLMYLIDTRQHVKRFHWSEIPLFCLQMESSKLGTPMPNRGIYQPWNEDADLLQTRQMTFHLSCSSCSNSKRVFLEFPQWMREWGVEQLRWRPAFDVSDELLTLEAASHKALSSGDLWLSYQCEK
nr:uncharacterized protein LOC120285819 [Drosophila simulans]